MTTRLRQALTRMSNKEVATRVGVRPETVSRWRNEKRPVSPRNRPKLAEALGEAPGWFWDDNGVAIEAPADSSFLSSADEMEEVDETKESEARLSLRLNPKDPIKQLF